MSLFEMSRKRRRRAAALRAAALRATKKTAGEIRGCIEPVAQPRQHNLIAVAAGRLHNRSILQLAVCGVGA